VESIKCLYNGFGIRTPFYLFRATATQLYSKYHRDDETDRMKPTELKREVTERTDIADEHGR
jgi:hypothetical protein